jgi:hypothetical protein
MERYLGDGLYASFDGFAITLRAPRENGDHYVVLEPDVYLALTKFVEHLKQEADAARAEKP